MSIPNHLFEALLSICRTPENRELLLQAIQTGGGDLTADEIAYDNADSGLSATDLQGAVDELATDSGGVATDLSNLTSPTAINQDLVFNKTAPIIKTTNVLTGSPQPLIVTGGSTSATTGMGSHGGHLTIKSGDSTAVTGTIRSGDLTLTSGSSVSGGTGGILVLTGDANATGRSSGGISVISGDADIFSGNVNFTTGNANTQSGDINLTTGTGATQGSIYLTTNTLSMNGQIGASGTFTTVDSKTVTVTNGLITSIV